MSRPTAARYAIRPCQTIEELEECVKLQQKIWGYAPSEVYPLRLFVNLAHIGGHVVGAYAKARSDGKRTASEMVGFVASMPAWRDGKRYLHSLSLGVAAGHENQGLGKLLKFRQRELALEAGIRMIEWTFDPLRAKNAFFNIVRLGAITRRYRPNYYGRVDSRLQQGLPSDRLLCEWRLTSKRVQTAVDGGTEREVHESNPVRAAAVIEIPLDLGSLAGHDPEGARKLQRHVRRQFETFFRRGLAVTGFERDENVGRYLLEPFHENPMR